MIIEKLLEKYINADRQLLQTQFIAPSVSLGNIDTRTSTGARFRFKAPRFDGWGIFQPAEDLVTLVRHAQPYEKLKYLELLPGLRMILIHQLRSALFWLAVPLNFSDAQQKGISAGPFVVNLVEDNVNAFDVVVARHDSVNLWYESKDTRISPKIANMLRQFLGEVKERKEWSAKLIRSTQEYKLAFACALEHAYQTTISTKEKMMQKQLSFLDAKLVSYTQLPEGFRIKFTGHDLLVKRARTIWPFEHSVDIDYNFKVLSAGICLSGEDEKFDLASIVGVLKEHKL